MYLILAKDIGLRWPDIGEIEHFMLGIYYEQALYDRELDRYNRLLSTGF